MKEPKKLETNIDWQEIPMNPVVDKKCEHCFEFIEGECRCKKCNMGLIGVISVVDGRPQ